MSGVEVAGLVLGVLPLVLEGMEKYRVAFEPLYDWWQFETSFVNFIQSAQLEYARFITNIERLLDFVTSDAEMHALLQEPMGPSWSKHGLQENIRERLGPSCDIFIKTLVKMNGEVKSLQQMLRLDGNQIHYQNAKSWEKELQRLRLSFSKRKFKHVKHLEKYNNQLAALLEGNRHLELPRRLRKATPLYKAMECIRGNARSLFNAIQRRSAWGCNCQDEHRCWLLLENPSKSCDKPDLVKFNLILGIESSLYPVEVSHAVLDKQQSLPTEHTLTAGEKLTELERQVIARPILSEVQRQHKGTSLKFSLKAKKSVVKKVGFAQAEPLGAQPQNASTSNQDSIPLISNLCSTVSNSTEDCCLGCLTSNNQIRHILHRRALESRLGTTSTNMNLRQLLAKPSDQDNLMPALTREHRFRLASTLAWSFLQFQDTPWRMSMTAKMDIVFPQTDVHGNPIHQRPFIFRGVGLAQQAETLPKISDPNSECQHSLLSLGILLLELCFGQTLEDQPFRKKYLGPDGQPNEFTDEITAKHWHRQVQGECGDEISEAIRRCLSCSFGPKPDWSNGEFVQAVHQEVIQPIDNFLLQWRRGASMG